ncbi:MAG: mobilome CxxCx(11)CxxC protein [Pseudomonadota bacterium]
MDNTAILSECYNKAYYSYGTLRLFEKRTNTLKLCRIWITFLGVIIPVMVGGFALSFGLESKILPRFIFFTGIIGMIQLFLSTWSLVARWDEQYDSASDSFRANVELFNQWQSLRNEQPSNLFEEYHKLKIKTQEQEIKDIVQTITDKEKRFAYREALKYFNEPCQTCNIIPITSKPSKCDGCGNFGVWQF